MRGFRVPADILKMHLKHSALLVYLGLLSRQKNGTVDLTYGQLAELLEIAPKSAYNGVQALVGRGLVRTNHKTRRGRTVATQFILAPADPSEPWVWVEEKLLHMELTPTDLHVYLYLRSRANGSGFSWPSIAQIHNDTGLAKESVRKSVRRLTQRALLHRTRRKRTNGQNAHNEYRAHNLMQWIGVMKVLRKKKARTRKDRRKLIKKKYNFQLRYYALHNTLSTLQPQKLRC